MSSHDTHAHGAHETEDFKFTHMLWVVPASIVILVTYVIVCMFGYRGAATAEMNEKRSVLADTTLKAFRAHEIEILSGYSWQDKASGSVRIPIDQAMNSVVEKYGASTASTVEKVSAKPVQSPSKP